MTVRRDPHGGVPWRETPAARVRSVLVLLALDPAGVGAMSGAVARGATTMRNRGKEESMTTSMIRRPDTDRNTCEACIDRDEIIAATHLEIALLQAEITRLRQRMAEVVRVLGVELLHPQ